MSLPGSSVHGILHARILEWVATPSSRGSHHIGDYNFNMRTWKNTKIQSIILLETPLSESGNYGDYIFYTPNSKRHWGLLLLHQ